MVNPTRCFYTAQQSNYHALPWD